MMGCVEIDWKLLFFDRKVDEYRGMDEKFKGRLL